MPPLIVTVILAGTVLLLVAFGAMGVTQAATRASSKRGVQSPRASASQGGHAAHALRGPSHEVPARRAA